MNTSDIISKANKLKPAEDYNKLRREGILHIEKLAGNVWTDYNTHDPGITLLEALCYAITDLAYRTGFDMKDLLAQNNQDSNAWKNIFYTAREILPCNPVTINDYRKLIMDVDGVRNAWITISKDIEVPLYINYEEIRKILENPPLDPDKKIINSCECDSKIKFPYHSEVPKADAQGLNFKGDKIIELNGLYKIILEYEEEIIEKKKQDEVRKQVLKVIHRHRNVCEDYLSVTGAEYKDFFLVTEVSLSENADADLVLAEMCYRIQNYFTPVIKFYSLDEMTAMGIPADEIFEGPVLKHGFIRDEELYKTDMFRDMRLSDIINFISDIEGINSLRKFKILEGPEDAVDPKEAYDSCGNEEFFNEWIEKIKNEKLVGRLAIEEDILKFFHPSEEDSYTPVSKIHFYKPSGEVSINTDRFLKLLNDFRGKDKYMKRSGFTNDFPVPTGENMDLNNFYPVQYELPFTYRVGESGLPLRDGQIRLIQSLQLKGYLAVFEQLFLNYLYKLSNMNEIFSFNDVKFKGKTNHDPKISACDKTDEPPGEKSASQPFPNQIIYKDEQNNIREKIAGYKCLYYDAEKYLEELQGIIQPESEFEWQRNIMLDHLLARFNEEMSEYVTLMKYMYPGDYLVRIIKNKTDLLSDYRAISNNRGRAYNYKLEEEGKDYESKNWDKEGKEFESATWDEDKIALNISGLEKRIARLIGLPDYKRKDLAPDNLFIEVVKGKDGKETTDIKIVLYEDETTENYLLTTDAVNNKCTDEIMHCFIESGCCGDNFRIYPEQRAPHHRVHHHKHHDELSFVLLDGDGKELAFSPVYRTVKLRDDALKLAKCFLEQICHAEGFHMIEHILLRPKGDTQLTDENDNLSGEEFKLLNICLDKCDLSINQDTAEKLNYKFDLQVLPPEKCRDGKRWNVILNRIDPAEKILEHQFKEYELASDFISKVRAYGSELINFVIYKTKTSDGYFYFKLKDENGKTLVESRCFKEFSGGTEEKAIPGKRTECGPVIDTKIVDEITALKKYLAAEFDLYCCEEPCDHDEDPYSFRLTFVLPCWAKRFRNKGFKKFVEKTIRAETPAHIKANIFWLGIDEMRNFEEPYFNWLIEMSCNDVPDIEICNNLIEAVNNLKNCDDECKEDEDMAGPESGIIMENMKHESAVAENRKVALTAGKAGTKTSKKTSKEKENVPKKKN